MATPAYNNPINEQEVSIAIERLLIANYPNTSWINTPSRVNLESLPSGFYDLGAVVEDTPSFNVSRKLFSLDTGIPAITQYQAVIGMEGKFDVSLHSAHWRKAQVALGNFTYTTSVTTIASIASIVSNTRVVFASVNTLGGNTIGRQITVAAAGNQDNIDAIETWISSITTLASGVYDVTFGATPVRTLTLGHMAWTYGRSRMLVGAAPILSYALLGVGDFIDGTQVVHYMGKVQPMGDFTEEIRPGQNQRTKLSFKAFGINVTDPLGNQQLVCAERYYFPKGTYTGSLT